MKNVLLTTAVLFFCHVNFGQEIPVVTQSVTLKNLIPFAVNISAVKDDSSKQLPKHLILLIQTPTSGLDTESKVILKQSFKLLSDRLSVNDSLSIVTYAGLNGIALKKSHSKNIKAILYAVEHLQSNMKEFHNDGIELAYKLAEQDASDHTTSSVVMIRNPETLASTAVSNVVSKPNDLANESKKKNTVLLTAITLIPQIISVIKD
ncbi:MAG: hypothetical protein GYB32_09835 [Algicola sp.]|nr:hypothetical protein [Algicola sp.]